MWIEEYRKKHGMTLEVFGKMVRWMGEKRKEGWKMRVSDQLIYILETRPKAVTHPNIADLLAEACGATPRQRDMIVAAKHRGTWRGTRRPDAAKLLGTLEKPKPAERAYEKVVRAYKGRRVVKLNRQGRVVERFDGVASAAIHDGVDKSIIANRCHRLLKGDEFKLNGHTYRFEDEWDRTDPKRAAAELRPRQ